VYSTGRPAEIMVPCAEQAPLSYYVLSNQTLVPNALYSYTALPDRYVDEIVPRRGQAIIYAVCEYDTLAFESQRHIKTNGYLGGELFSVVAVNTLEVVGHPLARPEATFRPRRRDRIHPVSGVPRLEWSRPAAGQ
jgi:hypothetical protein